MTATINLLKLLAGGQELASDELEAALGVPQERVANLILQMRKGRYMCNAPVRYEITPRGLERVARVLAREKRVSEVESERAKRVAARAAAKLVPLGRPRLAEKDRAEKAEARKAEKKRLRAAAKLEAANRKAAERAAAEAKRAAEHEADLRLIQNVVKARVEPDDLIAQTVRQQPALQAAWGAMA